MEDVENVSDAALGKSVRESPDSKVREKRKIKRLEIWENMGFQISVPSRLSLQRGGPTELRGNEARPEAGSAGGMEQGK